MRAARWTHGLAVAAVVVGLVFLFGVEAFASGEAATLTTWAVPTANSTPNGIVSVGSVVYFTEGGANKVGGLDTASNAITEWAVGQGPAELVAGPSNGLYFAERNGDRIGLLLPAGSYYSSESIGAIGAEPLGIALGLSGDNSLWFVERGLDSVGRLGLGGLLFDVLQVRVPTVTPVTPTTTAPTPTTSAVTPRVTPGNPLLPPGIALATRSGTAPYTQWTIPTTAYNLRDLVLAPSGKVYLSTETANLLELAPDTNTVLYDDLPSDSLSLKLALDASGRVWFTESRNDKVGRFDPTTGDVVEWSVPAGGQPFGIAVASDGTVWFAERERDQIGHLDSSANALTEYPLPHNTYPIDVTLDSSGQLWFTGERGNVVGRLVLNATVSLPGLIIPLPLFLIDAITGIHVTPVSSTEAQVTVDYVYSGGHGTPVYVGAFPTQGGVQQVAAFGFVPASIPSAGSGSVTVGLRYMASGCASTDGIRVLVYDATAGATFLTGDASYSADWGTCGSSSALPTISVTVDRGCGATYDPGDPITVLVSASEAVTATLVDFENTGLQKQTDLGLVPAFGAASVNGTVSGPAGLETLVVMARTASAVWISAGCTISVGGTSPSLVSLSLDRGCGATYHYGETATAIIQSSVAGIARLYEVTRDGQVAGMTILPLTPGLTETVSAPIGSITGTGTLVLQAESTSGQTLTASCSYSVLP